MFKTNGNTTFCFELAIGKDGSVGDEDLDDLASRVYHLGELNGRYEKFIIKARKPRIYPWMNCCPREAIFAEQVSFTALM